MLQVDTAGRLTDTLVIAYTHEAFAREAERVLRLWRFEPGRVGGEPVGSVFEMAFYFRIDGMSVRVRHGGGQAEQDLPAGQYAFQASLLGQLDRAPMPISASAPRYPGAWAHRGVRGRVTVEFYIDQEGRVRMPAVVAGGSRLLGGDAVATVEKWRFSPPTRAGVPTLVLAQQEFVFGSERALPPVRPQAPGRP